MGFREELEKDRKQQEKQNQEREYYRKICREVPYMHIDDSAPNASERYEKAYKGSLAAELSQSQQETIDEAIEFLEGWQTLPERIDAKNIYWEFLSGGNTSSGYVKGKFGISELNKEAIKKSANRDAFGRYIDWQVHLCYDWNCRWIRRWNYGEDKEKFWAKYKWSDGSIHLRLCDFSDFAMECKRFKIIRPEDLGKRFQERKVRGIMQEMEYPYLPELQRRLDMYRNHMLEGSQEYVELCYNRNDDTRAYGSLVIFRDGTVFDYSYNLYSRHENICPLKNNLYENLYEFLLRKIKGGKNKYDWP